MDSPSDITYSRAPPEDTGVRSCDGHANLMALAQEDRRWPYAELQFGRLSGNKRLGVVAGIARGWAQRIIRTFMRIHLLAVDRPECSLIQISDAAIGSNVFQIGEKCAVRRCGSNFEDYHGRPEISTFVASGAPV
jgi:hypothetical protein